MDTSSFDYPLPEAQIAQRPLDERDSARLLVDRGAGREPDHRHIADLPDLLEPGDLLVMNNTRVMPARLPLRKETGGRVEVFLLERDPDVAGSWRALVRPGRRAPPGTVLFEESPGEAPVVEIGAEPRDSRGDGIRLVRLISAGGESEGELIARYGQVPLPPYIHEGLTDSERYQTVYGRVDTSVAAPTAGLHLTEALIERCHHRGVGTAFVQLDVGLGTFRPIAADKVEEHRMHAEQYRVPAATWAACEESNRVVAIGTTTVRALESAATTGHLIGRTELFIHRPFRFQVVDGLVTNFHLPRSSLLVMVDAFIGPRWRELYEIGLEDGYRFLSFGDAMLLTRGEPIE